MRKGILPERYEVMIYKLGEIEEGLTTGNHQLSERFIGVSGSLEQDGAAYYITDDEGYRIRLAPYKEKCNYDKKLGNKEFFFGYVNELGEDARYLEARSYKNGLRDVVFHPFLDKLGDFLKDQKMNRGRDVETHLKAIWRRKGARPKVAVVCPQTGRVLKDLFTGINFRQTDRRREQRFEIKPFPIQFYQTTQEKRMRVLLGNLIQTLDELDRESWDLVVIIRGGSDLEIKSVFDDVDAYAAIATMQTLTACAVGHTEEHEDFKRFCDYYEETPSLLGVTLGDWTKAHR